MQSRLTSVESKSREGAALGDDEQGFSTTASERAEEDRAARKAFRRLMWFLSLLFVCSYLDRVNIGFASLSMNKELGLTETMFGMASAIFYATYIFAEIPSNVAMARVGVRLWIPRIMITWGIASVATIFAIGPRSLYIIRGFVGLAEAGFMPGVLLYVTYWFPQSYRARASTRFILAQPVTIALGSLLSASLLQMSGVGGISGWRWLFIVEGLPSIVLGVVAFYYLTDRPAGTKWLSDSEAIALRRAIQRDERTVQRGDRLAPTPTILRDVLRPAVLLLGLAYFGLVTTLIANSLWVPRIVRSALPNLSLTLVGVVTAIPPLCAVVIAPFWSRNSDQRNERTWHLVTALTVAICGWLCVAMSSIFLVKFVGLAFCSTGIFSAQSLFWTLPSNYLSARARPIGIAGVNSIGVSGSVVAPVVIGWLTDRTQSFRAGILFVAMMLVISIACILLISRSPKETRL
jgi:ACS family 4-hydroxyphenylacetate permease-like MFS transporter